MAKFRIPVRVMVPASGVVEVEAENLLEACDKVQADIDENGFSTLDGDIDYSTEWEGSSEPKIDDVMLPDGTLFPPSS